MGLSFLNKKIWHPGSFANMEKTWVTEQKYREVEIRAMEKAKKIKEEKVLEEMKRLQVDKGLIPASHLNRLDFMYQCPDPEGNQKSNPNEDFLLGKRLNDESNNIFIKNKNQKKNIVPMFADNYANQKNEDFVRIHEDPLYLILKEEKKQRKEIEQNPYKMKMIINEIKNDYKDSKIFNNTFDEKSEILNKKSNIIKLKENDENKKSKILREKSSDSDSETETEKNDDNYYRREKDKRNMYRDKYDEKYRIKSKEEYKHHRHEHRHEHRHRHKSRDTRDSRDRRNENKKYYY